MKILAPGTRLDQFEVISYEASDDLAIEYICLDRERSRPVTLKTLRPELLKSRVTRDYLAQSGAVWMGLGTHPHIVQCRNVLVHETQKAVYLVLQAVIPGRERNTTSLLSWMNPGQPLPVLQVLLFALQITRGMKYVTDQVPGFVYGDLKPESIRVGEDRLTRADVNHVRITDFGLAKLLESVMSTWSST